jgi:hypothetical protein
MTGQSANRPPVLDAVGKLCYEGKDLAAYLYQVPDDESQRSRLRTVLDAILQQAGRQHRELPRIAQELKAALDQPPSPAQAELLQDGFDRMVKLWQAARSGLF